MLWPLIIDDGSVVVRKVGQSRRRQTRSQLTRTKTSRRHVNHNWVVLELICPSSSDQPFPRPISQSRSWLSAVLHHITYLQPIFLLSVKKHLIHCISSAQPHSKSAIFIDCTIRWALYMLIQLLHSGVRMPAAILPHRLSLGWVQRQRLP
jgi:hypothetical protein